MKTNDDKPLLHITGSGVTANVPAWLQKWLMKK